MHGKTTEGERGSGPPADYVVRRVDYLPTKRVVKAPRRGTLALSWGPWGGFYAYRGAQDKASAESDEFVRRHG
jgi:hypothetical protein